jgi:serine/threonine protein kinase
MRQKSASVIFWPLAERSSAIKKSIQQAIGRIFQVRRVPPQSTQPRPRLNPGPPATSQFAPTLDANHGRRTRRPSRPTKRRGEDIVMPSSREIANRSQAMATEIGERTKAPSPTVALADKSSSHIAVSRKIGRYIVWRLLGEGGMGSVYEGYDPELSRKVAIKVIRAALETEEQTSEGLLLQEEIRARMMREAKNLAKLAHPNVVPIYDVGVLDDGSLYLAMEFVAGRTLRAALADLHEPWQRKVQWVLSAGEGLAAAHAAGLLHRDFKPDNVLVANDGSVKLLDFGLSRQLDSAPTASPTSTPSFDSLSSYSADRGDGMKTVAGSILGTPAYMAPEQMLGQEVDWSADLFAFSMVLFEAINGYRPFSDTRPSSRLAAIKRGACKWKRGAPWHLRKVIARGLSFAPHQRGESMAEVITKVSRALARRARWRRSAAWMMFSTTLAAFAVFAIGDQKSVQPECGDPSLPLRDIWNPQMQSNIAAAFEKVPTPFAVAIADLSTQQLQNWHDRWSENFASLCVDVSAEERTVQLTEGTREQARACLAEAKAELAALLEVWSTPTLDQVLDAANAVRSLSSPERCLDPIHLAQRAPLPRDLKLRQRVLDLREQVQGTRILREQANYLAASQRLDRLQSDALDLADPAVIADVFAEKAALIGDMSDQDASALVDLLRASLISTAANRPHLAARSLNDVGFVSAYRLNDLEQAQDFIALQLAQTKRAGNPLELLAEEARMVGVLAFVRGDFPAVERAFARQLQITSQAFGTESMRHVTSLDNLGYTAHAQDDNARAVTYFRAALTLAMRLTPEGHPQRQRLQTLLGEAMSALGWSQDARAVYAQAANECRRAGLSLAQCPIPTLDFAVLAWSTGNLESALVASLDCEEAERELGRRAGRVFPWAEHLQAVILSERGEIAAAQALAREALAHLEAEASFHPQALAQALEYSARVEIAAENFALAQTYLDRLAVLLQEPSEFQSTFEFSLWELRGRLAAAQGQWNEAREASELALEIAAKLESGARVMAQSLASYAETLLAIGQPYAANAYVHEAIDFAHGDEGIAANRWALMHLLRARIALSLDRCVEAHESYDEARSAFDAVDVLDNRLAAFAFVDAQIIATCDASGEKRQGALERARQSLRIYNDWDLGADQARREIERWLHHERFVDPT